MIHHNYDYVTNRCVGVGEGWRRRGGEEDEEEREGEGGLRKACLWCIVSKKAQAS